MSEPTNADLIAGLEMDAQAWERIKDDDPVMPPLYRARAKRARAAADRLAILTAAGEESDFLAFVADELDRFPCLHGPAGNGAHAKTAPMMWPELTRCIVAKAKQDARSAPDAPPPVPAEVLQRRIDELTKQDERTRAWIEERAGELHLRHSSVGKEDRFWNCSRSPCQQFAAFLRGLTRFECRARAAGSAGGNTTADCDYPFCGCYPEATRVLEAIEESGRFVERPPVPAEVVAADVEWLLKIAKELCDCPHVAKADCDGCKMADLVARHVLRAGEAASGPA